MNILLWILITLIGVCIYFLIRNNRIYILRITILNELRNSAENSTLKGIKKLNVCLNKYSEITYPIMMYSFKSIKKMDIELRKHIGWKLKK